MTTTDSGLAGTLLDRRYRVDALLARGGMSAVYRGIDTRLGRLVAIKVMDAQFTGDRSFVERFELEARSAASLHHPHIVAVHDQGVDATAGQDQQRAFLVMELVDGGTLRDLLEDGAGLDIHVALSILEPVLSALAAAHAAGLVHRDIKPENVLIGRGQTSSGGVVKVGDFGLVRAVASANTTSSSVILGTVAYLAPEQVTDGSASKRGDVYSVGILLYEMLTGAPPYTGDTALSVAYRHVNDDVPAPSTVRPGIPPALDDLVKRATARDEQARPADAAALLEQLQQLRAELGIAPVAVPVPATQPHGGDGERTLPAFAAVTAPVNAEQPGPRGTRALLREPAVEQPPPQQPDPGARSGRRRWIVLAIVLALLLAGGIGGTVWWLDARSADVPQVVGMTKTAAGNALRAAELEPSFSTARHNTAPSGTVISTNPVGGSEVRTGDQVTVVISAGKPVVPDITPGMSPADAEQAIRDAQLTPREDPNANEYSTTVPAGAVLTVQPKPGTEANIGDPVTLVLSKGPPPTPIPDVAGMSKDKAFDLLKEKGFEPYVAGNDFSEKVPKDHVIKTEPAAGALGGKGDTMKVGVYLSNAVEVPLVMGKSIDDAKEILSDAGLKGDFKRGRGNDDEGGGPGFGIVIRQDPDPGTLVKPDSKVKLRTLP